MRFASRAGAIARKEVRQLRRDRLTFGMIVGVPVMQLILFGYAINQDVRHLRAGVADLAGTQQARLLVADAEATQVIDVVERARDAEELEDLLRRGRIAVGILIPHDFERRLDQPARPAAQLLVDGSDPIVLAAARGLQSLPTGRASSADGRAPPARFEVRAYYNPERRSAVQIVPALIGVILTMTMVLFTAVAVVRERERGTLELLITTPVTRTELMVGKLLPYMGIGLIQVTLVLLLGSLLFRVPIRGTLPDVYTAALLFVIASLSLGLLISTLVETQFQAFQLAFFTFLPQILLSGFMFPFDGMPVVAQYLGEALPITHFIRLTRGIMLREASLGDMPFALVYLGSFAFIAMTAAALRFSKRLD